MITGQNLAAPTALRERAALGLEVVPLVSPYRRLSVYATQTQRSTTSVAGARHDRDDMALVLFDGAVHSIETSRCVGSNCNQLAQVARLARWQRRIRIRA